jgi:hypothetical protein
MPLLKLIIKKNPTKWHSFAPQKKPFFLLPLPRVLSHCRSASPSHVLAKASELRFNVLGYQHLVLLIYLLVLPFEASFKLRLSVFVEK